MQTDAGKIEVFDHNLVAALTLTPSDKKFMAEIVQHVAGLRFLILFSKLG